MKKDFNNNVFTGVAKTGYYAVIEKDGKERIVDFNGDAPLEEVKEFFQNYSDKEGVTVKHIGSYGDKK